MVTSLLKVLTKMGIDVVEWVEVLYIYVPVSGLVLYLNIRLRTVYHVSSSSL